MVNLFQVVGSIVVLLIAGALGYAVQMVLNTMMGVLFAAMVILGVVGARAFFGAMSNNSGGTGNYTSNRDSKGQRR